MSRRLTPDQRSRGPTRWPPIAPAGSLTGAHFCGLWSARNWVIGGVKNRAQIGVLGASGYTGAELVRLLSRHPEVELRLLTAERHAGQSLDRVFPHLGGLGLPDLVAMNEITWDAHGLDVVFCALPHGTTQTVVARALEADPSGTLKVIDLSADFRLGDPAIYETWYGKPHDAPALQGEAVYGLAELARDAIRGARLIACPGCYPTTAILPLAPLLETGLIEDDGIVIDAKSGVSGAGRALKEPNLFAEVAEGVHAYGIADHRHLPEIEQALVKAHDAPVAVSFTPHLVPMNRGILATIYVRTATGASAEALRDALKARYAGEPFVKIVPEGTAPATRHVRGSNHCLIGVFADRVKGRAIIVSALDNLVKGGAGQAVQDMNIVCGFAETAGLEQTPLFP